MTPTEAKAKYQDDLIKGFKSLTTDHKEPSENQRRSMTALFDRWTEQSDDDLAAVIEWVSVRKQWWNVDVMFRICPCDQFDFAYLIPGCLEGKDESYQILLAAIAISIVEKQDYQNVTTTLNQFFGVNDQTD